MQFTAIEQVYLRMPQAFSDPALGLQMQDVFLNTDRQQPILPSCSWGFRTPLR